MKTSAIRVQAPAKADVGTLVLGERPLRLFFVDLELRRRGLAQPLDRGPGPRIRRVRDSPDCHRPSVAVTPYLRHTREPVNKPPNRKRLPPPRAVRDPRFSCC